jgi:SAM-dependent methyltransferase
LHGPLNKIGEPTAVLVRTDLFHKVGLFNENMRQLVDMEMWVRLMASSHVGYIPKALSSVRIHARQASRRYTTEEIDRFETDRLEDTLRTSAIYRLLHWRVKCALRFAQLWRNYRVPLDRDFVSNTASRQRPVSAPGRRPDALIPPDSLHSVGSLDLADYVAVGEEFFRYFIELCELKSDDHVLDVGSGTGRMARPLTRYLKGGRYDGIDIVAPSVQWCERTYALRYPNFHFHFADIYNKAYNPDGKYKATEYRFPFETSSFDFVFLTSVFTHMLPQDVEHYSSEVVRVLKPGKRCLITYFLINPAAEKLIDEGLSHYHFKYELPGCRVEFIDTREAVVGYNESTIRGLYAKHRLNIAEPVLYGTWCRRQDGLSWQDMIIATKPSD